MVVIFLVVWLILVSWLLSIFVITVKTIRHANYNSVFVSDGEGRKSRDEDGIEEEPVDTPGSPSYAQPS